MNLKLKFIGLGYNSYYQASVVIYDMFGNLVFSGQTYNGIIYVQLKPCHAYKIIARSKFEELNITLYVNKCEYTFLFNNSKIIENDQTITFILTDYYYNNLKIEKGDLILWQR